VTVEEPQDPVQIVRDLVEPLEQLLGVDVEDRVERWELLEQPAPLIDPPHPLHQQPLGGGGDAAGR